MEEDAVFVVVIEGGGPVVGTEAKVWVTGWSVTTAGERVIWLGIVIVTAEELPVDTGDIAVAAAPAVEVAEAVAAAGSVIIVEKRGT